MAQVPEASEKCSPQCAEYFRPTGAAKRMIYQEGAAIYSAHA
jgi:hypothetical protein